MHCEISGILARQQFAVLWKKSKFLRIILMQLVYEIFIKFLISQNCW